NPPRPTGPNPPPEPANPARPPGPPPRPNTKTTPTMINNTSRRSTHPAIRGFGSEVRPDQVEDHRLVGVRVVHDRDQGPLVQRGARMGQPEPDHVAAVHIGLRGQPEERVLVVEGEHARAGQAAL